MIITVSSCKGGVGKSTTATTVAHALANTGVQVLLADLDSQAHAGIMLGIDPKPCVFDWLAGVALPANCVLIARDPHLHLLPGDSRSKQVDKLGLERGDVVQKFRHLPYPWVVCDTPAYGLLQEVGIAAADLVVIPFRCESLGLDGARVTLQLAQQLNPQARTILLPVALDRRIRDHQYNLGCMMEQHGEQVARAVPASSAVAEASDYSQTIWEFAAPHSRTLPEVRRAYGELVARVVNLGEEIKHDHAR